MNVLCILGHPSKSSLNHSIAEAAMQALKVNGHNVMFHDLYAEGFNPVLPFDDMMNTSNDPMIQSYSDDLVWADGIVIVHPVWWGMPPAIMKGWIDRAFQPGCAYAFEEIEGGVGQPVGLLKASTVLIFNTENTPQDVNKEMYGDADPLDAIWKKNVFGTCGALDVYRRMFHGVLMSTPELRASWIAEVEETVDRYFPVGMHLAA